MRRYPPPLAGHRISDSLIRAGSLPPLPWAARHPVDPVASARYDVSGTQQVKALKPKTRSLGLPASELPRLDNLVWRPDSSANHPNGVLKCPAGHLPTHQERHEVEGIRLCLLLAPKVARAARCKISAGRVGHHHVPLGPPRGGKATEICLDMGANGLTWDEIDGNRIMPTTDEGISDGAGEFASNEDSQSSLYAHFRLTWGPHREEVGGHGPTLRPRGGCCIEDRRFFLHLRWLGRGGGVSLQPHCIGWLYACQLNVKPPLPLRGSICLQFADSFTPVVYNLLRGLGSVYVFVYKLQRCSGQRPREWYYRKVL